MRAVATITISHYSDNIIIAVIIIVVIVNIVVV